VRLELSVFFVGKSEEGYVSVPVQWRKEFPHGTCVIVSDKDGRLETGKVASSGRYLGVRVSLTGILFVYKVPGQVYNNDVVEFAESLVKIRKSEVSEHDGESAV
jgi:hypothetical protein